MNLRLWAALAAAWFVLAQASALLGPVLFPQAMAGVCGAAAARTAAATGDDESARLAALMAGHGLCCPLCASTATPPPPLAVAHGHAPACLFLVLAALVVALVLGREPVRVCVRGPPRAAAA